MRKLFILLAAGVLCFACSKSTEKASDEHAKQLIAENILIGDLNYNLYDNLTAEVQRSASYMNFSDALTIPETVDYDSQTYQVTSIGKAAFYGCSNLTSVNIPNSVTNIGEGAFRDCTGLKSVILPQQSIKIADDAFENCPNVQITYAD